jgi:transposase
MKAPLTRFEIRSFRPMLRTVPEHLERLRTPEGVPLPPNTLAEMRRDLARPRFVREQIREIEQARPGPLEKAPGERRNTRASRVPSKDIGNLK